MKRKESQREKARLSRITERKNDRIRGGRDEEHTERGWLSDGESGSCEKKREKKRRKGNDRKSMSIEKKREQEGGKKSEITQNVEYKRERKKERG